MNFHYGPSPMIPLWDRDDVEEVGSTIVHLHSVREEYVRAAVPVLTGIAFAASYDLAGAAIVAFAPPPWKPIGLAMLAPGPSEAILFGVGYSVGSRIQEEIPPWML
jgi:hypothetical protein